MPVQAIPGGEINYGDQGSGTPLVLVHGFPLDSRIWEEQAAGLSSRCRVITPDLPGFGRSGPPSAFTIESLADVLHHFLTTLGALPCVLGGLSMGGYVALAYAKKYPSDLRGLVLVDTKADADTAEARAGRDRLAALARESGAKAVAGQMEPKMLAADTPARRPQVAGAMRAIMESCPPKTIEHALTAMRDRPDNTPSLASVEVPTLILVGDGDSITPPAVAEGMHRQIRGSRLAVIRGAGHLSPMEQPAQVTQALRQFMESLAEGNAAE